VGHTKIVGQRMLETNTILVVVELVDEEDIGTDLLDDGSDGIRLLDPGERALSILLHSGDTYSVECGKTNRLGFAFRFSFTLGKKVRRGTSRLGTADSPPSC
jgi:hypothetical protein